MKNKRNIMNIRKIHLNSPSNIIKNKRKLISNVEGIRDEKNYIIKLDLKLNESKNQKESFCNKLIPKKPRLFITKTYNTKGSYINKTLINVINDCYFCTKELAYIDDYNNDNKLNYKISKNKNKGKNNSKYNYDNQNEDEENEEEEYRDKMSSSYSNRYEYDENDKINNKKLNKNQINKNHNKSVENEGKMNAVIDLDKYNNPSNIRIKISNPYFPYYKNINLNDYQIFSIKKLNKSRSNNKIIEKKYYYKKDLNNNINSKTINIKKKLAPLKIKRKKKGNNSINQYSKKND